MATKPLELQSLKWPFVGLAILLALCTGWAVYDEVFPRRPWKGYQREFFKLEESHLKADLARAQKRLEEADTKGKLDALRKELQEATAAISGSPEQRRAYDAAVKTEEEARIKEAEAKLYLGFDKSEQDAVYYKLREARHEEDAKQEAELQKKFDEWQRKVDEKQRIYDAAVAHHQEATKAREAFQARKDKAQTELEKLEKPIEDLKKRIEATSGKWPQMEQYWIEDLKNSWGGPTVDRCQNCHMAVNKGGFSAPWEVLEARKNKMSDADMKAQFALDPEVIDAYQTVHDKICEDLPPAPAAIPPGGWQPPKPPEPMDPASATECRPAKAYERWLERAEAEKLSVHALRRAVRNDGGSGLAACAISAVDVALWDRWARARDVPLAVALGAFHDTVPVYGSGGFCSYDDAQLREQLGGWAKAGMKMVKMKVGADPDADVHRVVAAREAIGDGVQLFVDANGAWDRREAIWWAHALAAEADVRWLEEPVSSHDREGLRLVRDHAPAGVAVAAGEYAWGPEDARDLLGVVDVLQLDATRCGGLTGFRAGAALAAAHGLAVSAHCSPQLHLHACCATERMAHLEYFHDHVRIESMIFEDAIEPVDGALHLDRGRAGHGLTLNRSAVERHAA
jgi:L-alanine-DL-glutamate epimerase-like enolase superfamily enzyme